MAATRIGVMNSTVDDRVVTVTWQGLLTTDSGDGVQMGRYYDLSVQVTGTYGAGGGVIIQGSMDGGTTWGSLHTKQGTAFSATPITDNAVYSIEEAPVLVRPTIASGDGTTILKVYISGAIRSF